MTKLFILPAICPGRHKHTSTRRLYFGELVCGEDYSVLATSGTGGVEILGVR